MEHHKTEQYFIFELLGSALNQTSWDTIPEGLNWKYVYTLCKYHKIDNLAAYALDYEILSSRVRFVTILHFRIKRQRKKRL